MKLYPGEVICDKCNGTGHQATWENIPDYRVYTPCSKCHGDGKLDWLENIMGKREQGFDDLSMRRPKNPKEGSCYFDMIEDTVLVYHKNNWCLPKNVDPQVLNCL